MFGLIRWRLPAAASFAVKLPSMGHSVLRTGIPTTTFGVRGYRKPRKPAVHASNSTSIDNLLAKIPNAKTDLTTDAIMGALQSMNASSQLSYPSMLAFSCHRQFIEFSERIEHSANQFSADEAVDVFGMMVALGVTANGKVAQRLLRVIQVNIADLHADRVIQLAVLLQKQPSAKTILTTAIESVLPILLLKKLGDPTDHDLTGSLKILNFIFKNETMSHDDREQLFEYVMNALLSKKSTLSVIRAMKVFGAVQKIPSRFLGTAKRPELFDNVVLDATDAIAKDLSLYDSVHWEICLKKYAGMCKIRRQVYNERFLSSLAEYVIEKEPEVNNLMQFLYFFQKTGFQSTNVHEHFIKKIEENPSVLSTAKHYDVPKIFTCLTMDNTLPASWSTTLWPAIQQNPLYQELDRSVDWLPLANLLVSTGFYDDHLISAVLNPSNLKKRFAADARFQNNSYTYFLEIFQNCTLNAHTYGVRLPEIDNELITKAISKNLQNRNCPFQRCLQQIFGAEMVASSVRTSLGHFIQHIMKFNCTTGQFAPFDDISHSKEDEFVHLESISVAENERLVGVQVLQETAFFVNSSKLRGGNRLQHRALLDLKLIPLILNIKTWTNRNDLDLRDHILNEISGKIQNENEVIEK